MANDLFQSNTVLTSEVKIQDRQGAKMSVTFGENDSYGEYCYFNLKFKATETIANAIFDRDVLNIAGPRSLTLNNYKVWHEQNDGPNSGLNADLLDGKHATEFKDRYGYHHFMHMFYPPTAAKKHFVKIATFTTRKVGNAQDFTSDGKPPYNGTFMYSGNGVMGVDKDDVVVHGGNLDSAKALTAMAVKDAKEQFKLDTPLILDDHEPDLFHTTNLLTQGIYNGALRGTVTLNKGKKPTTFDFHIGLFEDPLCTEKDGWDAVDKFFYVSLHDETLNFLSEVESDWDTGVYKDDHLNPGVPDGKNINEDTDDLNKKNGTYKDGYAGFPPVSSNVRFTQLDKQAMADLDAFKSTYGYNINKAIEDQIEKYKDLLAMGTLDDDEVDNGYTSDKKHNGAKVSEADVAHTHNRPDANASTYAIPPATYQDTHPYDPTRMREPFPAPNDSDQGDSYQKYIDIMRLYHVGSRVDTIDNLEVVTHIFDLYLCVDAKTEVRVQPYMSTACLLYNFEPCIQEDSLPKRKFIRPKSIYDSRYASVRHRHYDYEKRIWQLTLETNEIWKNFSKYLTIDQGQANANKVMMTKEDGKIYAAEDNFERHAEPLDRREPNKVMITTQCRKVINGVLTDLACIGTSTITVDQLAQLDHVKANIQDQLDKLEERISDLEDRMDELEDRVNDLEKKVAGLKSGDFVLRSGDTMSGSLWIKYDGCTYSKDANSDFGRQNDLVDTSGGGDDDSDGDSDDSDEYSARSVKVEEVEDVTGNVSGDSSKESFSGLHFYSESGHQGGYVYGATPRTYVGLGVKKNVKDVDKEAEWAVVVTPEIDGKNSIACQFNGTGLRFCKGGRKENSDGSDPGQYFYIDFADVCSLLNASGKFGTKYNYKDIISDISD